MGDYASGRDIYEYKVRWEATWAEVAEHFGIGREAARSRARNWYERRDVPTPQQAIDAATEGTGEPSKEPQDDAIYDDDDEPPGDEEKFSFRIDGDRATAYAQGRSIRSLEQLLDAIKENGGDLEPWRVPRHFVNVWEAGRKNKVVDMRWDNGVATGYVHDTGGWTNKANWQVKAWFEPREEYPFEQAFNDLIARLENHVPQYDPPPPLNTDGAYLFVPNIYDAHVGKLSADGQYTVTQAATDFLAAARALASLAASNGRPVGRIMFPVGHDVLHTDNIAGSTTGGTWVETAADIRDAIDAVCWAVPQAIEAFASIAPVDVVPVESNHDRLQVHWLGQFLAAWFRDHPHVNVRTRRAERQYYQWERVGFGLTHEKQKPDRLAMMMPVEEPQLWAATTWREWLTGHDHTKQGMFYEVTEVAGVVIRVIPALCPSDTYHRLHLYVGNHRAAEGMFYHKSHGPAGSFPIFVDELAS